MAGKDLVAEAKIARENASAPFSKFKVGAALRTRGGKVFHGCNVENCTYGLTVCAERVALLSAIAQGERKFDAIAVFTSQDKSTMMLYGAKIPVEVVPVGVDLSHYRPDFSKTEFPS
ncbi:MAG: cytidine deaminase, partial [Thermoanaerobaculia bacterium]